jgi:type IV secretion system protein VirD4
VYADRPKPRSDDWQGQVRSVDPLLSTLPFRDLMQGADEEGGLKQQLTMFEHSPRDPADALTAEERLFEDETDAAADRNQMQRAAGASAGTIRRAHAVTRDDDDLLPAF